MEERLEGKINVLIADDSALMRKVMKEILESDNSIHVCGIARDGQDAVDKARDIKPDLVTMDINMPIMDGITALQYIVAEDICPVIMVSSLSKEGALITFEALELGAFDYVAKPGGTVSINLREVKKEIISKVKAASSTGVLHRIRRSTRKIIAENSPVKEKSPKHVKISGNITKAVCIGISTGGPKTLMEVVPYLKPNLGAAYFIVQHMPANFTSSFATRLDENCSMPVYEAKAGQIIEPNAVYLGRGGYHLLVRQEASGKLRIRLSERPEHFFKPSVDVMMQSVFKVFHERTVAVLMTGMGDDGADTMVEITQAGGVTIAESEETAIVFGMPSEAITRGGAKIVSPSYQVADEINRAVKILA